MSRKPYKFSPSQIRKAKQLWEEGYAQHAVCQAIGVTRYVFEHARQHGVFRGLKKRPIGGKGVKSVKNYNPTKKQIQAKCEKIRESWTGSETKERWIGRPFGGPLD